MAVSSPIRLSRHAREVEVDERSSTWMVFGGAWRRWRVEGLFEPAGVLLVACLLHGATFARIQPIVGLERCR
jgi:hypothetical protein